MSPTSAVPDTPSPFLPHGVAFLATLGACVAAAELRPFVQSNVSPILLLAVVISAWYGGFWPALQATVLGVIAFNYFFQDPPFTFSVSAPGDGVQLLVFTVVGLFISWLTNSRKRARLQAARALEQALHDPTTGLPNRLLLDDRLDRAIVAAKRDREKRFAVFIVNIGGLEELGSMYGYHFEPAVLRAVGQRMSEALRQSDTIARLDGSDFAILAPEVGDPANAVQVAEKLMGVLRKPLAVDGHSFTVAATFGISLFPDHGADSTALVDKADEAAISAKQNGTGYAVGRA